MPNVFDSPEMAAGYAMSRPAVHPRIIERITKLIPLANPVERALDVGCGAGLSTRPLQQIARFCLGIEPSEAMLKWAPKIAPGAALAVGRAEALPVCSRSIDLITAAGSLNYADLNQFFRESHRVLKPNGVVVAYDYSQGRSFRDSTELDGWYSEFVSRYPLPLNDSGQEISPEILELYGSGFKLIGRDLFEVSLTLNPAFYLNYAMTETNVADAVRKGVAEQEIRTWCSRTLPSVFGREEREVLFRGYVACLATG